MASRRLRQRAAAPAPPAAPAAPPTYLTLTELAARAGMKYGSLRTLRGRQLARYRAGATPAPWDLPEPDKVFGKSPVWSTTTGDAWIKAREDHYHRRP